MKAIVAVLSLFLLSTSVAAASRVTAHTATIGWLYGNYWGVVVPPNGFNLSPYAQLNIVRISDANRLKILDKSVRYSCSLTIDPDFFLSPSPGSGSQNSPLVFGIGKCVALAPTCSDGLQNQGETGVDCAGPCTPCNDYVHCNTNADCVSSHCVADNRGVGCDGANGELLCVPTACFDGVRDNYETDVDCGNGCTVGCDPGGLCNADSCNCKAGLSCTGNGNTTCQ